MLVTIHCYTAPIPMIHLTRMKLPYSDKRKKKFCFIYEYCQRSKFSFENKI